DAVRVLIKMFDPMKAAGHLQHRSGREGETPCESCFRVIASSNVARAVAAERQIIRVTLVFDEIASAPHDEVCAPRAVLERCASEKCDAVPGRFRTAPILDVFRGHAQ